MRIPLLRSDGSPTGEQEERDIIVQTGSYSYPSPDGTIITVTYVADENGFQPLGDHLPTPPPIPQEIVSSLAQQFGQQLLSETQQNQRSFSQNQAGFNQQHVQQSPPLFHQQRNTFN